MSEEKNESVTEANVPTREETAKPASPEVAGTAAEAVEAPSVQDPKVPTEATQTEAGSPDRAAEPEAPSIADTSSQAERPRADEGVEEEAGPQRPGFRPQGQDAESESQTAGDAAKEQAADAKAADAADAPRQPEEAPEYAPRPSDGVEDDAANTPKFADQHAPKEPKKERPAGSTGLIHRSNIAEMHPESANNVKADFLLMLSDSQDPDMFQGKRMTVTLGFKSKYIFDGDKVAKIMRQGAIVKQMEVPDEIVIGKVDDASTDPLKIKQAQKDRDVRNRGNIDAVAVQASAVLKQRALGRKGPTELSPALDRFNAGENRMGAAIVGERLDALNDDDLLAFAEKRTGDVSIAASRLMTFGIESPDPQKAAEYARDVSAAPDVDPSAPASSPQADRGAEPATDPATATAAPGPEASAPAPEPSAPAPATDEVVPMQEPQVSTATTEQAASTERASSPSAPETTPSAESVAPPVVETPKDASPASQEPAAGASPVEQVEGPSRPVLSLRGLSKGVGEATAASAPVVEATTPVAGDAGPRNIRDQARLVTGEGVAESRSKGNEAANDASNVIAFVDKSKGRD